MIVMCYKRILSHYPEESKGENLIIMESGTSMLQTDSKLKSDRQKDKLTITGTVLMVQLVF